MLQILVWVCAHLFGRDSEGVRGGSLCPPSPMSALDVALFALTNRRFASRSRRQIYTAQRRHAVNYAFDEASCKKTPAANEGTRLALQQEGAPGAERAQPPEVLPRVWPDFSRSLGCPTRGGWPRPDGGELNSLPPGRTPTVAALPAAVAACLSRGSSWVLPLLFADYLPLLIHSPQIIKLSRSDNYCARCIGKIVRCWTTTKSRFWNCWRSGRFRTSRRSLAESLNSWHARVLRSSAMVSGTPQRTD